MQGARLVLICSVLLATLLLAGGASPTSYWRWIVGGGILLAVPLYLGTRNRNKNPSATEQSVALVWLVFRRVLAFAVGGLIVAVGLSALVSPELFPELESPRVSGALGIATGVFVLYAGWFGQGGSRYAFRDDLKLHRENKKRYGWWF